MDLNKLRLQIDEIDAKMVDLFVQRMEVAAKIGQAKAENHLPVLNAKRENDVLQKVAERAGTDFAPYANNLYQNMFHLSRNYQARLMEKETPLTGEIQKNVKNAVWEFPSKAVVACQRLAGSHEERACEKLVAQSEIKYFHHFVDVCHAVESGLCQYGVLPIENSFSDSVFAIYDFLAHHKLYIVRSLKLAISQNDAQNTQNHYTRFICIAKHMEIYRGAHKISLGFSIPHTLGSLYDVLGKIFCQSINLCKLESRPVPGKDGLSRFYCDLDASVFSKEVLSLLQDMELSAKEFSFLGCYLEMA